MSCSSFQNANIDGINVGAAKTQIKIFRKTKFSSKLSIHSILPQTKTQSRLLKLVVEPTIRVDPSKVVGSRPCPQRLDKGVSEWKWQTL